MAAGIDEQVQIKLAHGIALPESGVWIEPDIAEAAVMPALVGDKVDRAGFS
jgi:hypothetical protein